MPDVLRFDEHYEERVTLPGGVVATIRLVRADDKTLLAEGLAKLSGQSRFLRFFAAKNRFTAEELRYLTELDGVRHVGLGAIESCPDASERGLGIARYVLLPGSDDVAEPAVVVLDDVQREGLGTLLCQRLVFAAIERGVRTFRFEVLASNAAMRALVRELCPDAVEHDDGEVVSVEVRLPDAEPAAEVPESGLSRMLALAAVPVQSVRRALDSVTSLTIKKRERL